jgi:hypothetical protein
MTLPLPEISRPHRFEPPDARKVLRRAHSFAAKHNAPKLAEDLMELLSDVRTATTEVERQVSTLRETYYQRMRELDERMRELEFEYDARRVSADQALEDALNECIATTQCYVQLGRGWHLEGMPDYEYKPYRPPRSRFAT